MGVSLQHRDKDVKYCFYSSHVYVHINRFGYVAKRQSPIYFLV